MSIAVESQCPACDRGEPCGNSRGRIVHSVYSATGQALKGEFMRCKNFDEECRHIGEPFGWIFFALIPRLCRNGKTRWLTWLERHRDGTYTYCNRAH